MTHDYYVYCLDDEYGEPFYVGCSNSEQRYSNHLKFAKSALARNVQIDKNKIILRMRDAGLEPGFYKIADGLTQDEGYALERETITKIGRLLLGTGPLTNADDGGPFIGGLGSAAKASAIVAGARRTAAKKASALTVKAIENFKPGASRREVPDGDVRGLYLQIFPSGKASWAFRYRFGGRTRKLTIGASPEIGLKDARDLARAAHLQIAGGEDPGAVKQAARTDAKALPARDIVEKVAAQFLARHVKNLAAATRIEVGRIVAKEILPTFRGRRLSEIKRPDVIEWLDAIVDRPAPIAANRALGWLKGLCNFAVERGVLDVSPIAKWNGRKSTLTPSFGRFRPRARRIRSSTRFPFRIRLSRS
jgi:hypothetical protein